MQEQKTTGVALGRPRPFVARLYDYRGFHVIALSVLLLDQASKMWVLLFSGLEHGAYPPFGGIVVIPGFFNLAYNTNTGAAWGMFAGNGLVLGFVAILALAGIYRFRKQLELKAGRMQVCMGLMAGGIVGNLIDRFLHHHVIDFLDFILINYRWPTFNIADSAIVCGAIIYSWHSFRASKATPA